MESPKQKQTESATNIKRLRELFNQLTNSGSAPFKEDDEAAIELVEGIQRLRKIRQPLRRQV